MTEPDALGGRRVALYVSGSIAAFKAAEVVTMLRGLGAEVRVAMTGGAVHFVTSTTFRGLSGHPVATSLWEPAPAGDDGGAIEPGHGMTHLALSAWAEVQVAVPASAGLIARIAHGFADDAVTASILACRAPLLLAPAMETAMWESPVTRANVASLHERGVLFVGPERGRLASGREGVGRMAEPGGVVAALRRAVTDTDPGVDDDILERADAWLLGKRVVITSGGTREAIDPVRFIGNRSSGRMGNALAVEATRLGARVTLITTVPGPPQSPRIRVVPVETADDMLAAVRAALPDSDVLIMAAAVADHRPAHAAKLKIKKDRAGASLDLVPTPDILAELRDDPIRRGRVIVGFAAETDDLIANARMKLESKNLDMIVANTVGDGVGMGTEDSSATLIGREGVIAQIALSPKSVVAAAILEATRRLMPAH